MFEDRDVWRQRCLKTEMSEDRDVRRHRCPMTQMFGQRCPKAEMSGDRFLETKMAADRDSWRQKFMGTDGSKQRWSETKIAEDRDSQRQWYTIFLVLLEFLHVFACFFLNYSCSDIGQGSIRGSCAPVCSRKTCYFVFSTNMMCLSVSHVLLNVYWGDLSYELHEFWSNK